MTASAHPATAWLTTTQPRLGAEYLHPNRSRDPKQFTDHDSRVLARRVKATSWGPGPVFGWARQQALQRGFDDITIGCEPTGHRCGILDQLAAQRVPTTRLNAEAAAQVATTLQPLATPSRLLILTELRQAPAR